MSHSMQRHDTQHGGYRARDATVPRALRAEAARQDSHQPAMLRAEDRRASASQLPSLVTEFPEIPRAKPRSKPTGIPQAAAKATYVRPAAPLREVSARRDLSRAGEGAEQFTQEVPLMMDPVVRSRMEGPHPAARRTSGRLDTWMDGQKVQSPLDLAPDAIFGVVMPRIKSPKRPTDLPPRLIPELRALAATSVGRPEARNTPVSPRSSPSTRLSNSPSPWSVSTTTTTPTSWSSASPGIVQPLSAKGSGTRQGTVPAWTANQQKPPKLPAVPETFSKSRKGEWSPSPTESRKSPGTKRTPLDSPGPAPPPRTSSTKQALSGSGSMGGRRRGRLEYEPTPPSSEMVRGTLSQLTQTGHENIPKSSIHAPVCGPHNDFRSLGSSSQGPSRRPQLTDDNMSEGRHESVATSMGQGIAPTVTVQKMTPKEAVGRNEKEAAHEADSTSMSQTLPPRTGKFSRFGFFGHRGKSPISGSEVTPRKLQRKGPAAGTGHEGYGKHGRRGRETTQESRSGSNSESERSISSTRRIAFFSSKGTPSRSSSRQNRSSQSDLDSFAASRLKPVPIIGGSAAITTTSGGGQDAYDSPQSESALSQQSGEEKAGRGPGARLENVGTLAVRRSQRFAHDGESFKMPAPIRTQEASASLYASGKDARHSSTPLASLSTPSTATDPSYVDPSFQRPKDKRNWKLRWNAFRRKGAEQEPEPTMRLPTLPPNELPVSISSVAAPRPMPYYAMIDSGSETNTIEQLPNPLPYLTESPTGSPVTELNETGTLDYEQVPEADDDSILLPSAPLSVPASFNRAFPSVPLQRQTDRQHSQMEERAQRQPRLARVGRIPAVPQRKEGQHRPNRASFSQPFMRSPGAGNTLPDSFAAEVHAPLQSRTHPPTARFSPVVDSIGPISASVQDSSEFLRFPSGAASEISSSSGTEGSLSIAGPPLLPILPKNGNLRRHNHGVDAHVSSSLSVDEVWNEYDDFIDHVMSPSLARQDMSGPVRPTTPLPEQAEPQVSIPKSDNERSPREDRDLLFSNPSVPIRAPSELRPPSTMRATYAGINSPSTKHGEASGEDIQLRRSMIVSALHSSGDPTSPFSIRDLLNEYDSHQRDSARSDRLSASSTGQKSEHLTPTRSLTGVHANRSHQEQVALLDVVERNKDPIAQSELQFASLMVAKWLSFGRVLFSPAHDEINAIRERHILVIDGLGNEDWSIYCAVTYERQQAFVHHLKEKSPASSSKSFRSSQDTPANYRRAHVASFSERFPFPPAFFSAIVLRFMPVTTEAKMKNMISECRRVLLPGGYLELLLLDLDIVNMGVQTRKAVRELKFRISTADQQINLRPIIDNVQSVLGARGFSNISRCIVGVPVAGQPAGSADSSSSSRSSGGSDHASGSPRPATASPRMTFGHGRRGANLSLNELIADHSDNADAKIGKIVSRTARAWWQHCFEASVIPDGDLSKSIFADRNILKECRSRGSSFKMFIAHAQRPVFEARRRTMSEPIVPTLATAGGQRRTQQSSSGSSTT